MTVEEFLADPPIDTVKYPAAILRTRAAEIQSFEGWDKVFKVMESIIEGRGIGLAAPQVGLPYRAIIVKAPSSLLTMLNPRITKFDKGTAIDYEGCLSCPGASVKVTRFRRVRVEYVDLGGINRVLTLEGLSSRITQHEIDHLDGINIVDKQFIHNLMGNRSRDGTAKKQTLNTFSERNPNN